MENLFDYTEYLIYYGCMVRVCPICKKEMSSRTVHERRNTFCSRSCLNKYYMVFLKGKNNPHWCGGRIRLGCFVCGKEYDVIRAKSKTSKFCSRTCQNSFYTGRRNPLTKGDNNGNWKGGISPVNAAIRGSMEYNAWRRSILKRDDFTCVLCGKRGVELNVDHIKSFADFTSLRFDINNGRTLCVPCHKNTENYGFKGRGN